MTLNSIIANFQTFKLADLLDIIIIAFLIYQLLGIINRTRAGQLAKGALLVLAVYLVANVLNMRTVTWLLNSLLQVGLLTLVVLFQPEIRRALERMGQTDQWAGKLFNIKGRYNDPSFKGAWRSAIIAICDAAERFSETKTGALIVLERNTDYYGKVPSIERIVYKTVAVESTKALMLRSGEADMAWLNAKYARTFRGKDGFTTVDFTTADLRTVAMDFHTPFWQRNKDSIAVLNYAVDKQAIVDGVLAGQGFPAFSPIQTSPLGGNPAADVYPYDLKKFAAEMERLGWKKGPDGIYARNGERFSFTIQVRDYEEERVDIINVLSRQFKKAGVEMNIALVTRFDWKAGYNGYLAGFAAEFDPDGVFKSFVTGASDNNMAYSSPKVDELLREGRATEDPAKRKAAYQAFEVAYAAMPAQLPLVYLHGNYVSVAGLKGLDTTRVLGHHAVGVMWNIEDWTLQR